jgi:hypothetical protein
MIASALTLTVSVLQLWRTNLKSLVNSYWLLTNFVRQSVHGLGTSEHGARAAAPARTRRHREKTMTKMAIGSRPTGRPASGLVADVAECLRDLGKALLDPYRPELHYMRGPGPKWHAKHDPAPATLDALPDLFGLRVNG